MGHDPREINKRRRKKQMVVCEFELFMIWVKNQDISFDFCVFFLLLLFARSCFSYPGNQNNWNEFIRCTAHTYVSACIPLTSAHAHWPNLTAGIKQFHALFKIRIHSFPGIYFPRVIKNCGEKSQHCWIRIRMETEMPTKQFHTLFSML